MRQRNAFIPTLREVPADAETAGHRLMLKAGLLEYAKRTIPRREPV